MLVLEFLGQVQFASRTIWVLNYVFSSVPIWELQRIYEHEIVNSVLDSILHKFKNHM